jgi:hypothetical protein
VLVLVITVYAGSGTAVLADLDVCESGWIFFRFDVIVVEIVFVFAFVPVVVVVVVVVAIVAVMVVGVSGTILRDDTVFIMEYRK